MADAEATSVPVFAVTAAVGAVVLLLVLLCNMTRKSGKDEEENETDVEETKSTAKKTTRPDKNQRKKDIGKHREVKTAFSHPWLCSTLKSHSHPVLDFDFSANGKHLVSCAEDRSLVLWNVREFDRKDHPYVRGNVDLDHATHVCFSPDTKAVIMNLYNENTIRVVKLEKKTAGNLGISSSEFQFPKKHKVEINSIGIASNGRFIMTSSRDTEIVVWNLKGEVLAVIDTHQMNNAYAAVSPCGKFIGSAGFTPDVKVWEVCFDKTGTFKEVTRAFELKGHKAGVHSFAFSSDSLRMASVSKDGTWRLWDTDVEYKKQQDPYQLKEGKHSANGLPSLIALSPDSRTVAIATGSNTSFYNTSTTDCVKVIDVQTSPVTRLMFDPTSRYLLMTAGKHIHIFYNVAGYQASVDDLKVKKVKATTQAMKDRVQQQIDEYQALLKVVKKSTK